MPPNQPNKAKPPPGTSREEITAATEYAFDVGPAQLADLLESAVAQRATPATIATLQTLPAHQTFTTADDLWPYLPRGPQVVRLTLRTCADGPWPGA